MPSLPKERRPPVKRRHIIETLRTAIVDGAFAPGDRLPSRTQLTRRFETGPVTVQAAMAELEAEGFVVSRDQRGTFVADHPPHRACYALVFAVDQTSPHWASYWTALTHAAHELEESSDRRIALYHGVANPETDAYAELLADAKAGRLAGVVYPSRPYWLAGSELVGLRQVPQVMIGDQAMPGMSTVYPDYASLVEQAFARFAELGCSCPAVLMLPGLHTGLRSILENAAGRHGLSLEPRFVQMASYVYPEAMNHICQLLFHPTNGERPDAVLVLDDNLLEPVTLGLIAAGVRPSDGLPIVAHCNFPWPTATHLPTLRLGYSTASLLATALALATPVPQVRPPQSVPLPAYWEGGPAPVVELEEAP